MKEGYKLHEIDAMDIHFYFELHREDTGKTGPKRGFIDQVL